MELEGQRRFLESEIDSLQENDPKIEDLKKHLDLASTKITELHQRQDTVKKDILSEHDEFATLTAQKMHFDLVHKN